MNEQERKYVDALDEELAKVQKSLKTMTEWKERSDFYMRLFKQQRDEAREELKALKGSR